MTGPTIDNPQLRELVELARAQRVPPVRATYEDIQQGVAASEGRRRGFIAAGIVAVAAVALAWIVIGSPGRSELAVEEPSPAQAAKTMQGGGAHETVERPAPQAVVADEVEVEVEEEPEPEPESEATLPEVDEPPAQPDRPKTAAELSRDAERALAAGRSKEAIRLLSTLVRKHPRSSHSRAGLIDLARLHKRVGSKDRARCAYKLYLDRYPGASLRGDVERALSKLGEGRDCRGLSPR